MTANETAKKMTKENMDQTMAEVFPDLRAPYEELLAEWERSDDDSDNEEEENNRGSHIVYGDIFNLYITSLLNGPDEGVSFSLQPRLLHLAQDERRERIKMVFDFLEGMLSNSDIYVVNVATVTVLEHINGTHELLALAEPHFGPVTRTALKELQEHWADIAEWYWARRSPVERWLWQWRRRRR